MLFKIRAGNRGRNALLTGVLALLAASLTNGAHAEKVYLTLSGNQGADAALAARLTSFGHTVTMGVPYYQFTDSVNLTGIDVVYLQASYNWPNGDMPVEGQMALRNFVVGGGGLVTAEWTLWKAAALGNFQTLAPAFPVEPTGAYDFETNVEYARVIADPVLNAGLPDSFTVPLEDMGGTRTLFQTYRAGASVYYRSGGYYGVVGWDYGAGRVLSFSDTTAAAQIADDTFSLLVSNAVIWAASDGGLPPWDINGDGFTDDADLGLVLVPQGLCQGEPGFNPAADANRDGCVDDADLGLVLAHQGE